MQFFLYILFLLLSRNLSVDSYGSVQYYHQNARIYWTFSQEQEKAKSCLLTAFHELNSKSSAVNATIHLSQSICKYCYGINTTKNLTFEITDTYKTKEGSLSHVYLRQLHNGKPILNSLFSAHYTSNMKITAFSSSVFCHNFKNNYHLPLPSLSRCLEKLLVFLSLPIANFETIQLHSTLNNEYYISFTQYLSTSSSLLSYKDPIKALASWFYHVPSHSLLPTWKFEISLKYSIDVIVGIVTFQKITGKPLILSISNWAKSFRIPNSLQDFRNGFSSYDHSPMDIIRSIKQDKDISQSKKHDMKKIKPVNINRLSTYLVYPLGIDSPLEGSPFNCTGPFSRVASPIGWNSDTPSGHSTYSTIGNNVYAQENHSGGEFWLSNKRPVSFTSSFIYPISNWSDPYSYANSSISNVFYWINLLHDILYNYGFDESAGNFQNRNFLRGGKGFDAVIADVQDGSGDSNASFMSPPDGRHGRMRLFLWSKNNPTRDGGLESCIIIHEYMHGVTSRLTGGPSNADCLPFGEAGGMGEGWGDFFSILLRVNGSTLKNSSFGIGEYSSGITSSDKKGIRTFPYSINNPYNYSSIRKEMKGTHAMGEVWAQILFDVYWSVIADHPFVHNPNWDDGAQFDSKTESSSKGPNDVMIRLLLEGMKLQPCWPTFIDARDAILAAEKIRYNSRFRCALWKGFASRGLGINALSGGRECFSIPEDCFY